MEKTEVLIIGAGPTGLVLALWLTKVGVNVRIIDKANAPGTTSRAVVFHARNLEFYHQLGIVDEVIKEGVQMNAANLWLNGKQIGHVPFSDLHEKISPFQYMMIYTQDKQEKMLSAQLKHAGIEIERSTELISFEKTANGVNARLRKDGAEETCEAVYICGCDGARSVVREKLGIGFPGGTYEETFYVADIIATGPLERGAVNIALDDDDFLVIFPLPEKNAARLIGAVRPEVINKKDVKWEDVSENIIRHLKINVQKVNWFSTYKVHHRVAAHFREDNIFILGDAAHIHSPVGGQGMNTGIGDAINLAWKLAAVINDDAPLSLLDTFEPERIAFAKRLVETTDNAFTFVSSRGHLATWMRQHVAAHLFPWAFGFEPIRRYLFRTLSQTEIKYPQSALSEGHSGDIKAGDRLPWVEKAGEGDNFNPLASLKWQLHIYGKDAWAGIKALCENRGIALHVFPYNKDAKEAGLQEDSIYIVRPDGYIGAIAAANNDKQISAYLNKWNISYNRSKIA